MGVALIHPVAKDLGRVVTLRVYGLDVSGQTVGVSVRAEIICIDSMGIDVLIEGEAIPKRKNRAELQWTE